MKTQLSWLFLHYIRLAAKLQLLKNSPTVIGITGSAGKTSAQHAVVAALLPEFRLKYTYNANSETGLPLSILGIKPRNFSLSDWLRIAVLTIWKLVTNWERYDILVAEMGIDSPLPPKNMQYLLTIVKPSIGVLLNAAPMHSETFDFLVTETDPQKRRSQLTQLISEEKGHIVTDIPATATAILNSDQPEFKSLVPAISANLVTFGKHSQATIQYLKSTITKSGTHFIFKKDQKEYTLFIAKQALADHYGYTFAATLAVADVLLVPFNRALKNVETHFSLEPGRSTLIEGINNSTILDSSYNSSAKPTIDMLEMLPKLGAKRELALLGDIREIGSMTEHEHIKVAEAAAKYADAVFLVGPQMKKFALPYLKKQKINTKWFSSSRKAGTFLQDFLQPKDVLLVKSSQNTLHCEIAVQMLMAHSEDAETLLCRRGAFWDAKRAEIE